MPVYNKANNNYTQSSSNSCHNNPTNDLNFGNENFYDNFLNFIFHDGNCKNELFKCKNKLWFNFDNNNKNIDYHKNERNNDIKFM